MSEPKSHPGQRGDAIVLTNLIPFRKIKLFVKFCQSKTCQAMQQVFPYDLGKVCLLNLTLFLHIPQHKYSVLLFTKFVGFFTCSLFCTFFYLAIGQHVFNLKENLYFVHINWNLSLY